jgi:hypothetical protein
MTELHDASRKAGFELEAYLVPAAYRSFGETYVYNLAALGQSMSTTATQKELMVRQESYHPLSKGHGGKKEKATPEDTLIKAVQLANQVWSLADAQAMLLRGWGRFMEIWVIPKLQTERPGRSRSSSGSVGGAPLTPSSSGSFDHTGHPGGAPDTPQGAGLSPMSADGRGGSSFNGDMRSFTVAREVSKSLVSKLPHAEQDLKTGMVVAEVATELADVLAAMLHHQLFEVKAKTADPLFSTADIRDESRLSVMECRPMLKDLNDACSRLFVMVMPAPTSFSRRESYDRTAHSVVGIALQLRLKLLTAALLLARVIVIHKLKIHGRADGGGAEMKEAEEEEDKLVDREVQRIFEHAAETIIWLETADAIIRAARSDDGASGLSAAKKTAGHLLSVCQSLLTVLLTGEVRDREYGRVSQPDQSLVRCLLHHFTDATSAAAAEFPSANDVVRTKQDAINQVRYLDKSRQLSFHNTSMNRHNRKTAVACNSPRLTATHRNSPRLAAEEKECLW